MASRGLKRKAVSLLALLVDVLSQIPGAEPVVAVLSQILGVLGGAAIGHAGAAGTLNKEKIAGAVSALYLLIFISSFVPALIPYLPVLYKVAGTLAAVRLGCAIPQKNV